MHTPGPWRLLQEYGLLTDEIGVDGRVVCTAWVRQSANRKDETGSKIVPWPEGEANARLIAAAPELLATLKALVSDPRHVVEGTNALADARELLRSLGESA